MRIIGIFGEPASGKTTVMRKFISHLGPGTVHKEGMVVYTVYHGVIVAGIYDDQVFSGTDRLSKGCGPKYREWLTSKADDPQFDDWVFYWEGERFSNYKFFNFFQAYGATLYYLQADPATLDARNAGRSNQSSTWRKGMTTRMRNLRDKYHTIAVSQGFQLERRFPPGSLQAPPGSLRGSEGLIIFLIL